MPLFFLIHSTHFNESFTFLICGLPKRLEFKVQIRNSEEENVCTYYVLCTCNYQLCYLIDIQQGLRMKTFCKQFKLLIIFRSEPLVDLWHHATVQHAYKNTLIIAFYPLIHVDLTKASLQMFIDYQQHVLVLHINNLL